MPRNQHVYGPRRKRAQCTGGGDAVACLRRAWQGMTEVEAGSTGTALDTNQVIESEMGPESNRSHGRVLLGKVPPKSGLSKGQPG